MELLQLLYELLFPTPPAGQVQAIAPAVAIGAGAILKGLGSAFGSRRRRKAAEAQRSALAQQRKKQLGLFDELSTGLQDAHQGFISDLGENIDLFQKDFRTLDIDRSDINELKTSARNFANEARLGAATEGFGRAPGEDIAREEARRSTANTLGQARRAAGSSADLLGSLALSQLAENSRMRQIDQQSAQQNANLRNAAQNRYLQAQAQKQSALGQSARFNARADRAEVNSENQRTTGLIGLQQQQAAARLAAGQSLFNVGNQRIALDQGFNNAIGAQNAAIANARANAIQGIFGAAGSAFTGFGQIGLQNQQIGGLFGQ